jgi:hypothetical protein
MQPREAARRPPKRSSRSAKYPSRSSQAAAEHVKFTAPTQAWLDFLARLLAEAALEAHRTGAVTANPSGDTTTS